MLKSTFLLRVELTIELQGIDCEVFIFNINIYYQANIFRSNFEIKQCYYLM